MAKNGNPEPIFFTDEEKILFLVTLPCHPDWLVTKSVTKSGHRLTREDVDLFLTDKIDFQLLNNLLDNDLSDVIHYTRKKIVTKSLTKSLTKIIGLIDFLVTEKTREELLEFLEIGNQTINFNANIKPLLENGIIELTIPDKPNSRFQRYRLTEKGRKLLKS